MARGGQRWAEISRSVPDLSSYVERRFASHEHHVIATIRSDGTPRVSGTNVMFTGGTLWVGMMPKALRTVDLRRTPRCALHSAPLNEKLSNGEGDVRINAIAVELSGKDLESLFLVQFPDADGVMNGDFFELRPTDFSLVEVADEKVVITRWSPAAGVVVTKHQ